jgi:hypothetical protein
MSLPIRQPRRLRRPVHTADWPSVLPRVFLPAAADSLALAYVAEAASAAFDCPPCSPILVRGSAACQGRRSRNGLPIGNSQLWLGFGER